jgi:hypothetical protein
MKDNNTTANTHVTKIDPVALDTAIKLLEEMEDSKPTDEELYKMIATLAALKGLKTMVSKYLPKGTVVIGGGEQLGF